MGWAQKPAVSSARARSTTRPLRRARGTNTDRCRPVNRGVETATRDRLSSPSVSVPPPMRRNGALVVPSTRVDVVANRMDLEWLYGLNSDSSPSPEAARTEMERLWHARSRTGSPPRRTVDRSATKRVRQMRSARRESRPVQNTVLAVAEQFLRGLEQEVADAEIRYDETFSSVDKPGICLCVFHVC